MANTIQIPKLVLYKFLEAGKRFYAAEDELEDFLLTTDKSFIKKMGRLRASHKVGRLGNWEKLKTKYGL